MEIEIRERERRREKSGKKDSGSPAPWWPRTFRLDPAVFASLDSPVGAENV